MFFGKLQELRQTRHRSEGFGGLNRREDCGAYEYARGENLSSRRYPLLTSRAPRKVLTQTEAPQGLLGRQTLLWVDGGEVWCGGSRVEGLVLSTLPAMCPKTMVAMGAYVVIFPDKVYVNTDDLTDFGNLENRTSAQSAVCSLCFRDGTAIEPGWVGDQAPSEPAEGMYWLDTGETLTLRRFSVTWTEVAGVYVKLEAPGIGLGFSRFDGVQISGLEGLYAQKLNGSTVLEEVGENFLVIPGILPATAESPVAIARTVPQMDFVTECGNRLWGCRYGFTNGRTVNEIYACALGDFKNWNRFQGLSTDSYAASRGADGCFTGAITYQGSPLFFREGCIERVYPDAGGAHAITVNNCRGVEKGSEKSLAIVDGLLFYKSPADICSYDGSQPRCRSAALGEGRFRDAAAGSFGSRYYVSMTDEQGQRDIYTYDLSCDLWHKESGQAVCFARAGGQLVMLDDRNRIVSLTEPGEETVCWSLVTGRMGTGLPEGKYLRRVQAEVSLAPGAKLRLSVSYDDSERFLLLRELENHGGLRTFRIPVMPGRCRFFRLRLEGQGEFTLHALTTVLEEGSEVPWL